MHELGIVRGQGVVAVAVVRIEVEDEDARDSPFVEQDPRGANNISERAERRAVGAGGVMAPGNGVQDDTLAQRQPGGLDVARPDPGDGVGEGRRPREPLGLGEVAGLTRADRLDIGGIVQAADLGPRQVGVVGGLVQVEEVLGARALDQLRLLRRTREGCGGRAVPYIPNRVDAPVSPPFRRLSPRAGKNHSRLRWPRFPASRSSRPRARRTASRVMSV